MKFEREGSREKKIQIKKRESESKPASRDTRDTRDTNQGFRDSGGRRGDNKDGRQDGRRGGDRRQDVYRDDYDGRGKQRGGEWNQGYVRDNKGGPSKFFFVFKKNYLHISG